MAWLVEPWMGLSIHGSPGSIPKTTESECGGLYCNPSTQKFKVSYSVSSKPARAK